MKTLKNNTLFRSTAWLLFILIAANSAQGAGPTTYEESRHQAFLRGSAAIRAALTYNDKSGPVVIPPSPAESGSSNQAAGANVQSPTTPKGGLRAWQWAGVIGGFVTGSYLIYHFATGPGSSIRDCGSCR